MTASPLLPEKCFFLHFLLSCFIHCWLCRGISSIGRQEEGFVTKLLRAQVGLTQAGWGRTGEEIIAKRTHKYRLRKSLVGDLWIVWTSPEDELFAWRTLTVPEFTYKYKALLLEMYTDLTQVMDISPADIYVHVSNGAGGQNYILSCSV